VYVNVPGSFFCGLHNGNEKFQKSEQARFLLLRLHHIFAFMAVTATCAPMCRLLIALKHSKKSVQQFVEGTGESMFTVFASSA